MARIWASYKRWKKIDKKSKTKLFRDRNQHLSNELNGSEKEKRERDRNEIFISKGGYGEIGRRYGLNWIEPWYGNLLSDNFQIQRNPGIKKNGQSWAKSRFPKTNKGSESENKKKDRCRDSMEAVLTNRVDCVALVK